MHIRKARLQDATNIYELVNSLSGDGTLLRRPFAEICENVRDFTVAESEGGIFLGCGALHLYGPHLAEVRSIDVKPEAKSQGVGGELLLTLLGEAEDHGVGCVCLFTRIPDFSFRYGFAKSRIGRRCRTRSLRTARTVHGYTSAMKWRWRAVRCRRSRFWGRGSRLSSWFGSRFKGQWEPGDRAGSPELRSVNST
jgi:N-acetylglutamate synthase-like GNAT family acetyltransferase